MTRSWIAIVAGACGLFVVTLGIRHSRSSNSAGSGGFQKQVASVFDKEGTERSGWIARPEAGGAQKSGNSAGVHAAGVYGSTSTGREGDTADIGSGAGAGDAAVMADRTGARGSVGIAGSPQYASSGSVQVNAAVPAMPVPFDGAKALGPGGKEQHGLDGSGSQAPGGSKDPGKDTPDASGLVLSLPFNQSTVPDKGDTAPVLEQGITCEGEGCKFSTESQFALPDAGNLKGDEGTISFCLQPDWNGGAVGDNSLVQLRSPNMWENRLQIFKNGRYLRFILTPNTGLEAGAGTAIDSWQPGQRHAVAAVWGQDPNSGGNMVGLYVDGQLVGQGPFDGNFEIPPGTPLYIGSDLPQGGPSAGGSLSMFQGYNHPLTADSVAGLAAGCAQ